MNIKQIMLPSLAACAILALAPRIVGQTASDSHATESGNLGEVDAYLEQELRRLNVPGAALVIVAGDEIAHFRGYGRARPGGEAPTLQTPFAIGSLTKSFTSLAVMQLVETGQVALDAPVQRYLPWFRVDDPQASAEMTVRHLLNQTSGLPQLPGMVGVVDFDSRPDAVERQVRDLSTLKLARPVGAGWEYSNLNFNILGLIIEATSGESYADYIQRHIFDPLDMQHSYASQVAAEQDGLAVGHRYWFGFPIPMLDTPFASGSLPSGQLIASAEDMGHYLIAHLNEGHYRDEQIVSSAGVDELHRPAAQASAMGMSFGHYGMGWFVEEQGQTTLLSHTGTMPDFFAFMALLPEHDKGLVLLVNANHVVIDKTVFSEVGMAAALRLAGETASSTLSGSVPWVLRSLLLIPVLQMVGVGLTLWRLRRWRQDPGRRPTGISKWLLHILLPLVSSLALVALPLSLLLSGTLRFSRFFMPDFAWLSLMSGGFAAIWMVVRSLLVVVTLQRPQLSRKQEGRVGRSQSRMIKQPRQPERMTESATR